jgi:NAD(P)-dependent dehydrogenase (short-subunit alcohol dehydrogenase family)
MRDPGGPGADLAETCEVVGLDVTDGDAVTRVVRVIVEHDGRRDVVVNNAGHVLWGPVEETPIEDVWRQFDGLRTRAG